MIRHLIESVRKLSTTLGNGVRGNMKNLFHAVVSNVVCIQASCSNSWYIVLLK